MNQKQNIPTSPLLPCALPSLPIPEVRISPAAENWNLDDEDFSDLFTLPRKLDQPQRAPSAQMPWTSLPLQLVSLDFTPSLPRLCLALRCSSLPLREMPLRPTANVTYAATGIIQNPVQALPKPSHSSPSHCVRAQMDALQDATVDGLLEVLSQQGQQQAQLLDFITNLVKCHDGDQVAIVDNIAKLEHNVLQEIKHLQPLVGVTSTQTLLPVLGYRLGCLWAVGGFYHVFGE